MMRCTPHVLLSLLSPRKKKDSLVYCSPIFSQKKRQKKNVPQCITIRTCIHLGFRIEWFFFSSLFFFWKKGTKNIIIIIIDIHIIADVYDEEEEERDDDFDDDFDDE